MLPKCAKVFCRRSSERPEYARAIQNKHIISSTLEKLYSVSPNDLNELKLKFGKQVKTGFLLIL